MDQQKLRNLVFEKTGVKVDTNDPIFALVALNEAVLAETVQRHLDLIDAATRALTESALAHGHGAAHPALAEGHGHQQQHAAAPAEAATEAKPAPFVPAPATPFIKPIPTQGAPLFAPREQRLLGAAAGLSLLSALVVLGGQALLTKPAAPAPVAVVQAPTPVAPAALTPEQTAAISQGEKLAKAVQKLDQKNRSLIQAEMQKP